MFTLDSFTVEEWAKITAGPVMAGQMVMMADMGATSIMGETKAMADGMMEVLNATSGESSLMAAIKERLTTKASDEEKSAMETMRDQQKASMQGIKSIAELKAVVMDQMTQAFDLLKAKGATDADIMAYKKLIYGAAEKTAGAAKEGGFMGVGGKRISDKEQAALDEIKAALEL
jgi:hypothetical protein